MSKLEAHRTLYDESDDPEVKEGASLAIIHPASAEAIKYVLDKSEDDPDGRSQFVWVRLRNGDLVLGVFPQGDTYWGVEADAAAPGGI